MALQKTIHEITRKDFLLNLKRKEIRPLCSPSGLLRYWLRASDLESTRTAHRAMIAGFAARFD